MPTADTPHLPTADTPDRPTAGTPHLPTAGTRRRITVIGAGMIGASAAMRLAEAGAEVTLIEAGLPGGGTSATSFAWTNANRKRPRPYFDLNVAGMAAHRRLLAEWRGPTPWLHLTGHLQWANSDAGWRALEDLVAELRAWGYGAVRLPTARALRDLEPDLRVDARRIPEMVFYPDEGYVDPPVLVGHLLARARSLGAAVRAGEPVAALETRGGRVSAVVLGSGERVAADAVLCCCGRWTNEVLGMIGGRVPLVDPAEPGSAAVGMLAVTGPVSALVRRVITAPALHMRPAGGGRLLLGADDTDRRVAHDTPRLPPPAAAEDLVARVRPLIRDGAAAHLESAMVGIRPLPADGQTIAGWADRGCGAAAAGLYVVVTHSGVTLGPLLGDLAASEVLDGPPQPLLDPFRPARFASG